jgi:hypothetical protein
VVQAAVAQLQLQLLEELTTAVQEQPIQAAVALEPYQLMELTVTVVMAVLEL